MFGRQVGRRLRLGRRVLGHAFLARQDRFGAVYQLAQFFSRLEPRNAPSIHFDGRTGARVTTSSSVAGPGCERTEAPELGTPTFSQPHCDGVEECRDDGLKFALIQIGVRYAKRFQKVGSDHGCSLVDVGSMLFAVLARLNHPELRCASLFANVRDVVWDTSGDSPPVYNAILV